MFALFALAALIASSGNLQEGKCDEYETLLYFLSECPTRCRSCDLNFTLTAGNGLAVSPTHIFSAQAEKAVVHVYSREKGNQEALVPFPERIRSIAVAGAKYGDVLVLGTEGGRLILWEV